MRINKIENTCSMVELGSVNFYELMASRYTKAKLINEVFKVKESARVIIYNTNATWSKRFDLWWKFGFKTKYSYKGNNGQVYVMFLKIK